tara:strand:- start:72 stop:392 length:321 start_codon:yes stop_codon:yes gene_type:complete
VIIPYELEKEIYKRFKGESVKIFELMFSLKEFPKKGKFVGKIGKIAIKELRYKSFRFYFLVDAFKVKFLKLDDLENLLIKFIRMSDKKNQQKVIDEIKDFLRKIRS